MCHRRSTGVNHRESRDRSHSDLLLEERLLLHQFAKNFEQINQVETQQNNGESGGNDCSRRVYRAELTNTPPRFVACPQMLVVFKSAPILKRTLKVRHAMMQLYVLKLLKMQTKYLGRQWRKTNMKTISVIYAKVRHRLNDDWAYGNGN